MRAFSATRKVAECPEYRHVVPGHPPLCDLSAFDAEDCPEVKLRLATRRWKGAHWPLLRALIRSPCGDEITLGNKKLYRLHGIGKNRRILSQKFLDLIKLRASMPGVASQWRTTSGAMSSSNASGCRLFHASKKRRITVLFCSVAVLMVKFPSLLSFPRAPGVRPIR